MKIRHLQLFTATLASAWMSTALAVDPWIVIGHKAPDTDSITAAIAVAQLKTRTGQAAIATAQGEPNAETHYVLETCGLKAPEVIRSVAGRQVFLVDHSDYPLAPDDMKKAELVGFVDHHKLGGLTSEKPVEVWAQPVGSSATVIARMYAAANQPVPKNIACGMLAAILSDTVVFKSPTSTPEDRATATKLAEIAGIQDMQALGIKMFEVKSDIKGTPVAKLLRQDLKDFDMNGKKVAVAQLEMMDLSALSLRKPELLEAMNEMKLSGYHSVLLMLTDIMKEGTELLVLSDDPARIQTAIKATLRDNAVWLPGVMSRKKQIIPDLEVAFKQ